MFVVGADKSVTIRSLYFLRFFLHPTYEFSKSQKVVSTLSPLHVTNSMSGMSRSFGISPSEYPPMTGSNDHANSMLLSIPRNTGLSDLLLPLVIVQEASWHASMFCSPSEEGVGSQPHTAGVQLRQCVCYTQRQRSLWPRPHAR